MQSRRGKIPPATNATLSCVIAAPKSITRYEHAASITLPGIDGELQVLPGHAEAFFLLAEGAVRISQKGSTHTVPVPRNAVCYVQDNHVAIMI